jgi:hypothetical protein
MPTPRSRKVQPWTRDDHEDNSRRMQRDADRRTWDRLGRLVGIRGRELVAAFGRMLDDRIAAYLRAHSPPLIDQLKAPADAVQLRGALVELISDDVVEMFQILTGQVTTNERDDKEETPGSSGAHATYEQRDFYQGEAEEA